MTYLSFKTPLLAVIVLLASVSQTQAAFTIPDTLRVGVWFSEPFYLNGTGYEASILQSICEQLNVTCNITQLPTLQDRIDNLTSNKSDITLGSFVVTPERAAIVDFVRPYLYSTGQALFTTSQNASAVAQAGWAGIKDKGKVCVITGTYFAPILQAKYGMEIVNVTSYPDAKAAVESGKCVAFIGNDYLHFGLQQVDLPTEYPSPVALAVAKNNTSLQLALSGALVQMMHDGNSSQIMQFEKDSMIPAGLKPNPSLAAVVKALTNFTGVVDTNTLNSSTPGGGSPMSNVPSSGGKYVKPWDVAFAIVSLALLYSL